MHTSFLTAGVILVLGGGLAAASPQAVAAGAAGGAEARVHSLVVQLRDAPTHEEVARERAAGAAVAALKTEHSRARWQRLLATMPDLRVTERRAVGESAHLVRLEQPMTRSQAEALAQRMAADPAVAWAAPSARERRLQASNAPNDPDFGRQWWLQPVVTGSNGAPDFLSGWLQRSTGSANSLVAVLDNGIVTHPDLAGKIVLGPDLVSDTRYSNDGNGRDNDPSDPGDWVSDADRTLEGCDGYVGDRSSWHGTAIAGMLAAKTNDGQGVAGMNWPGRVLAVRVAGKCGADAVDIVDGIRWVAGLSVCVQSNGAGECTTFSPALAQPRARVISISFGGTGACDSPNADYQSAINAARQRDVVVVAAAGNEHAAPTRPAKCAGVIGVAALNRDGFKATYSNFGSTVGLSTVGGDDADGAWGSLLADSGLYSVTNNGPTSPLAPDYHVFYGTSFSTPIVAGAASLMLAVNPALTVAQVEQGLKASARPHVTSAIGGSLAACSDANPGRCLCTTTTCGAGILDVPQALAYAKALADGNPYTAPNWPAVSLDNTSLRTAAASGPDRPANPLPPDNGNGGGGGGGSSGGGGGGGTTSAGWLLGLVLACASLRRRAG